MAHFLRTQILKMPHNHPPSPQPLIPHNQIRHKTTIPNLPSPKSTPLQNRIKNQGEQLTSVLLLKVSGAETHQSNLEAEDAHLSCALAVVHIEQPVEAKVHGQGGVHVRVLIPDGGVEGRQHHQHVRHVNEPVVLTSQSVLVEDVRRSLHLGTVHWGREERGVREWQLGKMKEMGVRK